VVICGVVVIALIAGTLVYFLVIKGGAGAAGAKGYEPLYQTDPALLYSNPTLSSQPYSMM
jgi:hypothetical protein